jgi:L-alanine-DL-glutamate epimerase-like enolase superfamily enzyme
MSDCKSLGFFVSHPLTSSDFHGRVHKGMAKQLAQLLEPHRPLFIEEPLLPGHVNELKDLYNKTTIPIAVSLIRFSRSEQADPSARRTTFYTS